MSRWRLYGRMAVVLWLAARIALELVRLGRSRRRLAPAAYAARQAELFRRQAVRLRETAVALGGLLIKLGQFLSTRVDVLPEQYTHELAQLQDMVPPVPAEEVRPLVGLELGKPPEEIFAAWEDVPIASASFGQVHRARLTSGETVAVKVQRPHIEALVRADLAAVAIALAFADRWTRWGERVDLGAIFGELRTVTLEELNYVQEAQYAEAFAANSAGDPLISVPAIYHDLTRRRVLVMEYRDGMRISDRAALVAAGVDPGAVSRVLVQSYLRQVLRDGFFHADPHPGNIFVRPDGGLTFVDFGMMGHIAKEDRAVFGRLVAAVIARDLDGLIEAIRAMGFLRPHANTATMKKALGFALDQLSGVPISAPSSPDFQTFLDEMRDLIYSEPFQLPVQYAYLGRAIGILLGLATGLDPEVDFVALLKGSALPYLNLGGEESGTRSGQWDLIWREIRETALLLYRLPRRFDRLADRIEGGNLRVQVELTPLVRRLDEVTAAAHQLARATVTAAAGVAAALLTAAGRMPDAHLGWAVCAVLAIWTFVPRGPRRGPRMPPPPARD